MAKPTTNQVIAMLNEDVRGEHGAIIQYLRHAYAMGEVPVAFEIEAIAREEMYHLKWLCELIVELGGKPTIERGHLDLAGNGPPDWMFRNTQLEQEAIDLYHKHLSLIDDPRVVKLLNRIVLDELSHKGSFTKFVDEVKGLPAEEAAAPSDPKTLDILNVGVRHEYTVVLQYLYHSFVTPHCDISRDLEFQAINEMQHLGWLAEKVTGLGAEPDTEHTEVDLSSNTADMLRADIAAERAVTMDYNAQINELSDEGLKTLLARIRDHEIYHDQLFSGILGSLESGGGETSCSTPDVGSDPAPKRPTVGSLLGEKDS
jgi:bacterioferritin